MIRVIGWSLQAKLWGIPEGLQLAISLNIRSLTVELDAMMVVHLLKMPLDDIHLLSTLKRDCLLLIVEMGVMQIQHIFRESNKCVNHLANLAQNSDLGEFYEKLLGLWFTVAVQCPRKNFLCHSNFG
ncbi:hypothetical protein Gotur_034911 [Gossypium turneri]